LIQLLDAPIPRETVATCNSCVMLPDGFTHEAKCCTYTPKLPPFVVGQLLGTTDADQPGRASVIERLDARTGVSPLGVFPPALPSSSQEITAETFGRAADQRCPHYLADSGHCGIWKFRNAVCSTWFCKHDRGAIGSQFWEVTDRFLREVETELAAWCALELGVSRHALAELARDGEAMTRGDETRARLQPVWTEAAYAEVWGDRLGREREYFRQCAQLIQPLDVGRVLELGGAQLRMHAEIVERAHQRLTAARPEALVRGSSWDVRSEPNACCSMMTYSAYDRVQLPAALFELLPEFDGRPTAEVLAAIADEHALVVEPDEIDRLVDFAVLVEAD
jgi:hypothetical protein